MPRSLTGLLEGVAAGDDEAASEWVERFQGSARSLAAALFREEADDIVQDAFLAALERLHELRSPEAFPAWFRQVVRTCANRRLRRKRELSQAVATEQVAAEAPPVDESIRCELRSRVRAAMSRVPKITRATAELFYFEERSISEVAEIMSAPVGTVKRRLHDARERLRVLLAQDAGDKGDST